MTPAELAALHAVCFTTPRPWSKAEFAALLATSGALLLTSDHGFLLARVAAGEAELLTLAVAPAARRTGEGRDLVRRFVVAAEGLGATVAFLEVASDNPAAQALYRATGWHEAGRRRGYYAPGIDALVLRRDLAAGVSSGGIGR